RPRDGPGDVRLLGRNGWPHPVSGRAPGPGRVDPARTVRLLGPKGGPLDYGHFGQRVWNPATGAGLTGLAFHDLRRANATGIVFDGVDLKTAQTPLGHGDPRLTIAVYAQATTAADEAAAERLGTRFMEFPRSARGLGPR